MKPRKGLKPEAAAINHITEDMVADAPYIEQIMPRKIDLDLEYIPHASVLYDIKLIFQTFAVVIKE